MNKFCFTLLLFGCYVCSAQTSFQKVTGTPLNEHGFSVKRVNDGGYIICGMQYRDTVNTDIYLLRTDANGDTLWIKYYGGPAADYGEYAEQTSDGGFIISGITSSYGAGFSDVYLIKTNSLGDTLWTRAYGGTSSELGHSVKQTSDGGYILAGHTDSYGTQGDFYLIKTNANGDTLWTRAYGGIKHDHAFCVTQTSDNGFIAVGHSLSFGTMGGFYAVKTNAQGDTLWTRGYGGNGNSFCYSVEQTSDGGYILGGETECFGAGLSDFLAVKLNSSGDTIWAKTYGGSGSDFLNCVKPLSAGGYIMAGYTDSYGAGGTDAMLVKTDANGNVIWSKLYGGAFDDEADAVDLANDGGYIISGSTKSFGAGGYDVYVVKADSSGNASCSQNNMALSAMNAGVTVFNVASHSIPTPSSVKSTQTTSESGLNLFSDICSSSGLNEFINEEQKLAVYPNPVTSLLSIEGDERLNDVLIFDSFGKIVYNDKTQKKKIKIDVSNLADGIYLLRINGGSVRIIKSPGQ